jgi:hypothetical protein
VSIACPICDLVLDEATTPSCPCCGLTWRMPSARAVPIPAAQGVPVPRTLSFRPRAGDLVAWTVGIVLATPFAVVVVGSAMDGSLKGGALVETLALLFCASAWIFVATAWARVVAWSVAPLRLRDEGDVISLRSGGLGARGRAERRVAKADLDDVVLEPLRGVVFQLWVVHRRGPAFRLDAETLRERGERLGGRVRALLGERAGSTAGYRGSGTGAG